jgi:hypothetical protein
MRNTLSRWAVVAVLGAGCAVDATDDAAGIAGAAEAAETTGVGEQAIAASIDACFVDLGIANPSVPLSRRFNSSCSTPTSGSFIVFRTWDFGDGTGTTTGGTITDHTFPVTNTCYKVKLTVFDATGASDDVFHHVTFCTVGPCNPVCPQ